MSKLIFDKLTEAQQLLTEARQEETEGAVLNAKIAELQRESERLHKSAREKLVIWTSQYDASRALAKEHAIATGELVVEEPGVAAAASTKKGKGGRKAKATVVAVATPAAAPVAPKKGKQAKKAAAPVVVTPEPVAAAAKPAKKKAAAGAAAAPSATKAPKAPKVARAPGEKGPPLHEKIKIVMGAKEMTIPEVIEALKTHDKSWVPKSQDLGAYISLVLSTHLDDHFDRVKRGVYKVKKTAQAAAAPAAPTGPGVAKTGPKKANGNGHSNGHSSNGIDELGTNVLESPFSGAEVAA